VERGYQHDFSGSFTSMYDVATREKKARTMVAVLSEFCESPISGMRLLDVGSSTGIIDNSLADYFGTVVGIDIDSTAVAHASPLFKKDNLEFQLGDAMNLQFPDNSFDVVICTEVYEHVPDAFRMMDEIFRVLKPNGVCYFAAANRIMLNEPHYNLPLLSVIPRPLANVYLRLMRKSRHYHELHYTYWGLRKLVRRFVVHDYTPRMINAPAKYSVDYMIPPGSVKARIASFLATHLHWLSPRYIWLLQKPRAPN
jgi:ubiquinone/menaquinone biosynthesis C-methylase UbiE